MKWTLKYRITNMTCNRYIFSHDEYRSISSVSQPMKC